MEKIAAWKKAGDADKDLYDEIQDESVAAVLKGIGSDEWEKFMRRFHSNDRQLQRLLGRDNLNSTYKDKVLAYVGGGGVCGGGTGFSLPLNMPDAYKAALDSESLPDETLDDGSEPMPLPEEG